MDNGATQNGRSKASGKERLRENHLTRRDLIREQSQGSGRYDPSDPNPVEVALDLSRPPTLKEELQRYVRYEVSRAAQNDGYESFEEFDDFTEEDPEPDWESEYEMTEMQAEEGYPQDDLEGDPQVEGSTNSAAAPAPSPDPNGETGGTPNIEANAQALAAANSPVAAEPSGTG